MQNITACLASREFGICGKRRNSIEQIARKDYPETSLLQQVGGVGPLIALTFVLTVEDKDRFQKSRDVGCYVGLRPRRSDSGQSQPQLRITKEGDPYLRTMLVQGAHYIISRRGPDTDLKRWGMRLAGFLLAILVVLFAVALVS